MKKRYYLKKLTSQPVYILNYKKNKYWLLKKRNPKDFSLDIIKKWYIKKFSPHLLE